MIPDDEAIKESVIRMNRRLVECGFAHWSSTDENAGFGKFHLTGDGARLVMALNKLFGDDFKSAQGLNVTDVVALVQILMGSD